MYFVPYVIQGDDGQPLYVRIEAATNEDLKATKESSWQTDWNSSYLSAKDIEKFSLKTSDGELIALGAYQAAGNKTYVYIIYLESAPHSNPTRKIREKRKYYGIGEVMIAFGIKYSIDKGCRGVVIFDAKTDELAKHYAEDFHALEVSGRSSGGPKRFMLADKEAWELFSKYLNEEEKL